MIIQHPTANIAAAQARLQSLAKQQRFAATVAINRALGAAQRAQRDHIRAIFDRPSPYITQRAVVLQPAKVGGPLEGVIELATQPQGDELPAGKPLVSEVTGGVRRAKRSEVLLRRAGLLPAGWLTVPGRDTTRDAYGNLHIRTLLEVLAWFKTYGGQARSGKRMRSNISDAGMARKRAGTRNATGREYFAVRQGDGQRLRPGIYVRQLAGKRFVGPVGARPKLVLLFVPTARYRQRMQFVAQAEAAVRASLPGYFRAALQQALETAR